MRSTRGQRHCHLAPRGSAKSTWASFLHPLREVLAGRERFVVIASDTADQAKSFLRQIKGAVEDRADLRTLYRVEPSSPWKDHHLRLSNGCEVLALGTGGKIRGRKSTDNRRPTLIVVDDPQNREHIVSPLQRDRSWVWLTQDVLEAGEPDTNVVVLGTALHRECIVCRLQHTAGWQTRVWQSITRWPARMDLWGQWEALLNDFTRSDEEREAQALAYYHAHEREMNE